MTRDISYTQGNAEIVFLQNQSKRDTVCLYLGPLMHWRLLQDLRGLVASVTIDLIYNRDQDGGGYEDEHARWLSWVHNNTFGKTT